MSGKERNTNPENNDIRQAMVQDRLAITGISEHMSVYRANALAQRIVDENWDTTFLSLVDFETAAKTKHHIPERHLETLLDRSSAQLILDEMHKLAHSPEDASTDPGMLTLLSERNNLGLTAFYIASQRIPAISEWARHSIDPDNPDDYHPEKVPPFHAVADLLEHPDTLDFITNFSYEDFMRLMHSPNIHLDQMRAWFMIEQQEFARLSLKLQSGEIQMSSGTWPDRLRNLALFQTALGRHGVSKEELYFTLAEKTGHDNTTIGEGRKLAGTIKLSNHHSRVDAIRRSIREKKGINHHEILIDEALLRKIKILENPRLSPTSHVIPTYGYEIESNFPPGMIMEAYAYMDIYGGFQRGNDSPLEIAHGVFRHPLTARTVFRMWNEADFFDSDQELLNTYHDNMGVQSLALTALRVRLLQMTGDAYQPFFSPKELITRHHLDIKHEIKEFGRYTEAQEFFVVTPEGTDRHIHQNLALGIGQMALEEAYLETHGNYLEEEAFLMLEHKHAGINEEMILNSHISEDQKKLAIMHLQMIREIRDAFSQIDLEDVFQVSAPIVKARKFYKNLAEIYPDVWSRYTVNPQELDIPSQSISHDGRRYPNTVAYTQSIVSEHSERVYAHLDQMKNDFLGMLREIKRSPLTSPARYVQIYELFERFPLGSEDASDRESQIETLLEVYREEL